MSEIEDVLSKAESLGFSSIRQLHVFLLHAKSPSSSITEVTGLLPRDPAYRSHYNIVRKLMNGEPCRKNSGLKLLIFGGLTQQPAHHKDLQIILTAKGFKTAKALRINS